MARKKEGSGSNTNAALKRFVDRLENLEAQKKELGEDFKALNQEIKSDGFDVAVVKATLKLKQSAKEREKYALIQTYATALQLDLFGTGNTDDEAEEIEEAA